MPHRQGKMPQTVIHPCPRGRRPTPLPKRRKASRFCGCCLRFCCCSSWPWHFCAVQGAHLCRPYRQNFVRSIARCGAAGWRRMCPLTKRHLRNFCKRIARRRTAKPCSTCWMPYRRHSLRPIHAPPKPRRRYRPCAVNYAKSCADERCEGCARGSFTQEIIDDSAKNDYDKSKYISEMKNSS